MCDEALQQTTRTRQIPPHVQGLSHHSFSHPTEMCFSSTAVSDGCRSSSANSPLDLEDYLNQSLNSKSDQPSNPRKLDSFKQIRQIRPDTKCSMSALRAIMQLRNAGKVQLRPMGTFWYIKINTYHHTKMSPSSHGNDRDSLDGTS